MRIVALVLVLAAAGCSTPRERPASEMSPQVTGDPQIVMPQYQELIALDAEVEMLTSREDCTAACEAGARLCALSERICEIATREPDPEIEGRCIDGRARCTRANERLSICACGE